jgi:hypothetical protein
VFSGYDLAAVVSLVWADVVSNHEAVVTVVVFGDDTVPQAVSVAARMWIGTVLLFVHAEPILVSTPVAPLYSL